MSKNLSHRRRHVLCLAMRYDCIIDATMQLVLIRSPQSSEEQLLRLKPGRNTLGSDTQNDFTVCGPGILPHHLEIDCHNDAIHVFARGSNPSFYFQGKDCSIATIKAGESFSINNIAFYCQALADNEPTQHALLIPSSAPSVSVPITASAQEAQISGFVRQCPVKFPMLIGRNSQCDLVLEHPLVSGYHARISRERGEIWIEDLDSSNGTHLSDVAVRKAPLQTGDSIMIMPYILIYTGQFLNVYTFQQESKLIGWQISVSAASTKIIDRVTIACASNELVGLIGPSGSGKTTLMKCLSGQTLPSGGRVQLNGLDIYTHFPLFKRNIGFVPQDDIIHRELTVQQTLMYAARLRLPPDMTERERKTRVWETLIELELEEQERQPVHKLSGGQRKRVNIAIELLTKPGILFLDEPTSGLDPALDEKLMLLFKKLSQDGRITILTTHLLEHADMFTKIALMHHGRLIFFGTPPEGREYFEVDAISGLYSRIKERPAEEWQDRFQKTPSFAEHVDRMRDQILPSRRKESLPPALAEDPPAHQFTQWRILSQRYTDIILRDPKNTGILLLQAPLIAFFIQIATSNLSSKLFMMALAALWFGCNNSAREICKEIPLYRRERMVHLSILPYLCSKFVILSLLVILQCLVLAALTPSDFLRAYFPLVLSGLAGIGMGLFISSIVNSPDKAIALVPILLIPQVLFSGIFGELHGGRRALGEVMISKWSYNLMKKEFELPSYDAKKALEATIDENQDTMKSGQERIDKLQKQLRNTLADMKETLDPVQLEVLQYDSDRILNDLRKQQREIEDARSSAEAAEKQLRENASRFVWIDRPNSHNEWLVLSLFTLLLLAGSAFQIHRKDRLLLAL